MAGYVPITARIRNETNAEPGVWLGIACRAICVRALGNSRRRRSSQSSPTGCSRILTIQGEQGSAKSCVARILRRVIDPAAPLIRTMPCDERDLAISASNSWMLAYDNISTISPGLSDALCQVATGGGFSTRKLCSDSEEALFEAARPIVLNGIDYLPDRPDLADRSLVISLPEINPRERKSEQQVNGEFAVEHPSILGGLLDAVSTAFRRAPDVTLDQLPRMADFVLVALAAEPALAAEAKFLPAYSANRYEAVQNTLAEDSVATAVMVVLDRKRGTWQVTCGDLLFDLEQALRSKRRPSDWPGSARGLSGRLLRLAPFLRQKEIYVTFSESKGREGGECLLFTERMGKQPPLPPLRSTSNG